VFTGDLSSISRPEATDLVKRYGGCVIDVIFLANVSSYSMIYRRVVGAPSSKTSFVIVGDEPGASKLEKVKKLGLKTLDEDGFLELIAKSKPQVDKAAQVSAPAPKPAAAIRPDVTVPPVSEKMAGKAKIQPTSSSVATLLSRPTPAPVFVPPPKPMNNNGQLWTDKYKPKNYVEVIGNKALMEKLAKWLREWYVVAYHIVYTTLTHVRTGTLTG
jgi:replication factor C subunit 1